MTFDLTQCYFKEIHNDLLDNDIHKNTTMSLTVSHYLALESSAQCYEMSLFGKSVGNDMYIPNVCIFQNQTKNASHQKKPEQHKENKNN